MSEEGANILYWHVPPNRSSTLMPDDQALWDAFWDNRTKALTFAHTHPGGGVPAPSFEDITSFSAIERGLGRSIEWVIASSNAAIWLRMVDQKPEVFYVELGPSRHEWLTELRNKSNEPKE